MQFLRDLLDQHPVTFLIMFGIAFILAAIVGVFIAAFILDRIGRK